MDKKRKRIERKPRPQEEKKKVWRPDAVVWEIVDKCKFQHLKPEEIDLDAPVMSEKERIKMNSMKYAHDSIVEAFNKGYNMNLHIDNPKVNEVQANTYVGQVIPLKIVSISKEGVVFDNINYKELFITRNNLWKYPKFHEFIPTGEINAMVIEKDKKRTVVDIFAPMIHDFLAPLCETPWIQNKLDDIQTVKVKNLHLVKGGLIGDAVIPNISEWLGSEYTIPAFVPGSQLTLNVTNDFESWEGKDVDTFITSYDQDARGAQLVCSRKAYIRHLGHLEMMKLFSLWCDNDKRWDDFSSTVRKGVVTGVINSSRKCGVFVEYLDNHITGMIQMDADLLTSYPIDMPIEFKFDGFEEELEYDESTDQYKHQDPFEIEDNILKKVNVKPVFKLF